MAQTAQTKLISSAAELRSWRSELAPDGGKKPLLGFVPTMGALHAGHMSLVSSAISQCRNVIVSIFVNPLQFGPAEDLDAYPRTLEADIDLCRQAGVTAIFQPSVAEMYPHGRDNSTVVVPPRELTERLCGIFRPGHFTGVATVVTRLFSMVQPDVAYFGEKDYQQLVVIKRLVADLALPLKIEGMPIVREKDGLALSSRNAYLSPEQRRLAPVLHETLSFLRDQVQSGVMSVSQALEEGKRRIESSPGFFVQYLESCDPVTLKPVSSAPMVMLTAAKVGGVRLIDNICVGC